jgi:uncharacterized protein YqgC (DUF456 family)
MDGITVVVGLIMFIGLIGIAVPVLPGLLLVWLAVLIWSADAQTTAGWVTLGIATMLALTGLVVQYIVPSRRLRTAGVTTSSTMAGAGLAAVGFFVLPVIGAFLGFVLGVYLAERIKLGNHAMAWTSTMHALRAIGLSMGIEMATGLTIAATWLVAVATTT